MMPSHRLARQAADYWTARTSSGERVERSCLCLASIAWVHLFFWGRMGALSSVLELSVSCSRHRMLSSGERVWFEACVAAA
jgi:hypothetical protein